MILQIIAISILGVLLVLTIILLCKKTRIENSDSIKNNFINQREIFEAQNKLVLDNIKNNNDTLINTLTKQYQVQLQQFDRVQTHLDNILKSNEQKLDKATNVLNDGLAKIQENNEKKLDQMRQTVDEKLSESLEKRLTNSFNIVNERLQSVYEGLGEMKKLATGVGDLKKVLTNVKTRGTWGEIQLENLLSQMLTQEQFTSQLDIRGNGERVDFAVILPGKNNQNIWLPIDAKFPMEDYQKVVYASENGNKEDVEQALKNLEKRVKEEAKSIKEKYIVLPHTTDFAIMYLAIEGVYAEVLRRPGLAESLQQDFKVIVCGPTTLTALLNSLQLGFKTLAIEKRSSEIYGLLGMFKQEFGKFVELLAKTQKKLNEASNTIEFATKRSQSIEKKLRSVSSAIPENCVLELEDDIENNTEFED